MADYYVDFTGGNDANAGTSSGAAWKNLHKLHSSTLAAGDNVYLKKGETWYDLLWIEEPGTSGNEINISTYGTGDDPLIYGDYSGSTWTAVTGHPGIWELDRGLVFSVGDSGGDSQHTARIATASVNGTETTEVAFAGFDVTDSTTARDYLDTFEELQHGPSYAATANTNSRYFWVKGADEPKERTANGVLANETGEYVRFANGIAVRGTSVATTLPTPRAVMHSAVIMRGYQILDGLDIRNANRAVWIRFAAGSTVQNCNFQDCVGRFVHADAGLPDRCTDCIVQDCTGLRCGSDFLYCKNTDGTRFRRNSFDTLQTSILDFSGSGDQAGIGVEDSDDCIVEDNTIDTVVTSYIDTQGADNTTIRRNYCFGGLTKESTSNYCLTMNGYNLLAHSNIFDATGSPAGQYGANAVTSGNTTPASGDVIVYNNIFWGINRTPSGIGVNQSGSATGVKYYNNIIALDGAPKFVDFTTAQPDVIDYNCYYAASGTPGWKVGVTTHATLAAYQAAESLDVNSIEGDPTLTTDPPTAAAHYAPQAGSNCINAGLDLVPAIVASEYNDYAGTDFGGSPDIGAYEVAAGSGGGAGVGIDLLLLGAG